VEFRSIFRTPSKKFKILAIPDALAHRKSYEHGFMKKCDSPRHCNSPNSSRFDTSHYSGLLASRYAKI
ncbi:hypothetical protein BHE74_00059413, partial [Ensete ventricosum]